MRSERKVFYDSHDSRNFHFVNISGMSSENLGEQEVNIADVTPNMEAACTYETSAAFPITTGINQKLN
jgi:hypothetical protein